MSKQIEIKVPFGVKGWKECKNQSMVNGQMDAKKMYGAMFNYLIDGLMTELKKTGYRSIGRGRILFEEACDHQANMLIGAIIRHKQASGNKKIAGIVTFTIGNEIPKVE